MLARGALARKMQTNAGGDPPHALSRMVPENKTPARSGLGFEQRVT